MPRYTPNMAEASFGFVVLPKGTHRVSIDEPKAFEAKEKDGTVKNFGVRLAATIVSTDSGSNIVGKPAPIALYYHSQGGINYSKGVIAAIIGAVNDEDFNERFGNLDWSFDSEDGSCGQGWHELKGKVVDVECGDPQPNKITGDPQSNIIKYRIVS